jgi:CheY-like chemotaxis protein
MSARDCILVVDDSSDSPRILVDALEAEGIAVLIALDAEGALIRCTPQVETLFNALDPAWTPGCGTLPQAFLAPAQQLQSEHMPPLASLRFTVRGMGIEFAVLEPDRPGETLIRLTEVREHDQIDSLPQDWRGNPRSGDGDCSATTCRLTAQGPPQYLCASTSFVHFLGWERLSWV